MSTLPHPFGGGPVAAVVGESGLVSISTHSKDEVLARRLGHDLRPVGEETEVIPKIKLRPLTSSANAVLKMEVEEVLKEKMTVAATRQGERRERGPDKT